MSIRTCFGPARLLALGLLLSGLCLPIPAAAAESVPQVMEKFQATYAALESFRATFEQSLTHQESGTTEQRKGTLLFRKPLLARWETEAPHPELLLVTKDEIWNYLPDEELAYRYSLEVARDSRSLIMVVTGQSPLSKDFDVELAPADPAGGGLIHLLLYPKEPAPQLTEAQLWLDPKTFLIRRAQIIDFYGNVNDMRFTSMTPDAAVKSSDFTFQPPAGVEVEDHTDNQAVTRTPLAN